MAHTPTGAVVPVDDFLIEFANIFRDVSGLVSQDYDAWGDGVSG